MKRTLLLAGCLLLCAGCAKKKPQFSPTSSNVPIFKGGPADDYGLTWTSCIDMKTGLAMPCPDKPQSKPLPPMVAPTMRDVVTHQMELSCTNGYKQMGLVEIYRKGAGWEAYSDRANYIVCVTPAFIAELKRANGEQK